MRKQVQKERCTKIMLTKCKAVCHLYDKVQLAAAKMLDAEPAIFQFECNVPILCNDIPANDLNLPSETYTTDFVLHYDDGHTAVREAVFRSFLSRPSVAEKWNYPADTGSSKVYPIGVSSSTRRIPAMWNLDILAAENGEHVRVLLCGEEQSYVVSCQHFRMPYPVASDLLAELQPVPAETYSVFVLDEDITNRQREGRNRKLDLIAPLLEDACIYDKSHRNEIVRQIAAEHNIARRTVLQYLWRYWVYQSKNALLPAERPTPEQHELTADEKTIRWALNKYYYTPQRQSLQTAYKMMLRAKYCDTHGTLKPEYPTFWQFRYFFRKNRDPISETISRQGLKAYQRNHRPFTGSVCDYAHTIGVYMTDATIADIYIVSRLSRKPIGRPVIYTMVDAYSRLITGVYVGLEGGQYALRLLLQNTFTDKVSFCHQHGIDIDPHDWPSHHLPTKIITDRGSEFTSGPLENLCESYHIEIENLPAYRPDLKGVVEKLFDLIQSAYKPLLKGKGVIESDTQERGAPDYRRQGTLDLEQFTAVVLRCVLFYNAAKKAVSRTRTGLSAGVRFIIA